ncbi:DUF3164 family protein [Zoogloea sp.]|uniref:DUF3164 family protein n=1 Tax=Zoogloea sp. TaxID=49181 RepID=UPI002619DE5C|nr:DUF3164 family protein [Zoogloea sp.]
MTAANPTPTTPEIPSGHMRDSAGRLVPLELIKPIDLERDKLVCEIVQAARSLNDAIGLFKGKVFGDIEAFIELSSEQYGVKPRGSVGKGNVTLSTFDGRYKVQRAVSECITFDERLVAAKALIDECISEWAQGARAELHVLVNDAFQVDKSGNIATGRVLALRRIDIKDTRWQNAMRAIGEAVQVVASKSYVRVYERIGDSDRYRAIPLDVAAV